MNIQQLIDNAIKYKDFNAAKFFQDILNLSVEYNISINDTIQYFIEQRPNKYKLNLLILAQQYYPRQNTNIELQKKTDSIINISNKMNVQPLTEFGCTLDEIKKLSETKPKIKSRSTKKEQKVDEQ